jgi:HEAT repeat protein
MFLARFFSHSTLIATAGAAALVTLVPIAGVARTQPQPQQPRPQAPPPIASRPTPLPQVQQDALVQRAREALRAGRAADAITFSESVLTGAPDNQAAMTVKIDAMIALGDMRGALRAYDGFVSATGRDFQPVLATIARAQLKALTQATLVGVKVDALEALAAHGDAESKATLQKLMKDEAVGRPAIEAMARLGDKAAAQQVVQLASQAQGGQRVDAIYALATIKDAPADALVREALGANDPALQAAGADVAAARGMKALLPELRQTAIKGIAQGQYRAAVALVTLGDAAGRERVAEALASDIPDSRLSAASALRKAGGDKSWVARVEPLLTNQDGLNRFRAAEMLLSENRTAAMRVLHPATADPNPVIRAEAARILSESALTDLSQLRPYLSDPAPRARLWAAKGVLAKTPAPSPAPAPAAKPARR